MTRARPKLSPLLPLALLAAIACSSSNNNSNHDSGSADGTTADTGPIGDADPQNADAADAGTSDADPPTDAGDDGGPPTDAGFFTVSGRVTFDWVEAKDDITEGGARLDYTTIEARPARRVLVQALNTASRPVATTLTRDDGSYSLEVPANLTVQVRVRAETSAQNYTPDGIAPDRCNGASWRTRIVDNTQNYSAYVLDDSTRVSDTAVVDVHAALVYQNGYVDRTAAPFALIDNIVTQFELVCEGVPDVDLPLLNVNWSVNNVASGDDVENGEIGTSYYDRINSVSNLFIVGEAEVDSDEYDDHIIAHETGHYLEDRLYRSDSQGGDHVDYDSLEPATAFAEGYGNAISGMTFDDPVYVDTSGPGQVGGFSFDVSEPPSGDDRGIYSEWSAQYFLWSLYENRDAAPRSGNYDRLHDTLRNHVRTTEALTSLQTFAAYYNQTYGGDAENIANLWANELATPYNSLCAGACNGAGDLADVFDTDNDIGREYAGVLSGAPARRYPQGMGETYHEEFWRLYPEVQVGLNVATPHSQSRFSFYDEPDNKFGAVRWYRLLGTGGLVTVSAVNLGASSCDFDVLDLAAYELGREIAEDYELTGCPRIAFPTTNGRNYVLIVYGLNVELPSWDLNITSQKPSPPIRVEALFGRELAADRDHALTVRVTPGRDFEDLSVRLRGVEGVVTAPAVTSESRRHRGRSGESIEHTAKVTLREGVAGYVVADVSARIGARTYRFSKPFPARTPGAKRKLEALGTAAIDERGEKIQILRPSAR